MSIRRHQRREDVHKNLDVALALALAAQVTKVRNSITEGGFTAPPITMQLINKLAREETIAQSQSKLMSGREMIRHIGAWVAVKSDHGQRYNINDLLALRLDDKNPNGDLYGFFFKWQDVYSAISRSKTQILW